MIECPFTVLCTTVCRWNLGTQYATIEKLWQSATQQNHAAYWHPIWAELIATENYGRYQECESGILNWPHASGFFVYSVLSSFTPFSLHFFSPIEMMSSKTPYPPISDLFAPTLSHSKKDKKLMAEWSDLPIDVLEHLTSFLPLPDYHRFSAVCQNWGTAAKQRRYSPAKQLPWLLVQGNTDQHKRRIFSISENRHYNIDFPKMQGQFVCGSSYGWLFTVDKDLNLKLLNPLMGKSYDLPPLLPFSDTIKRFVRESIGYPFEMTYGHAQIRFVYKAILDHDPTQRPDFTVLILNGFLRKQISFWRPGNLAWTLVEDDSYSFDDIAYFNGKFYACNTVIGNNVTYVVDVGLNPKVTLVAPEVPMYDDYRNLKTYLVDFHGELLMLQMQSLKTETYCFCTRAILVYKLDLEKGKYYQCHHLDGYSIFLGNSSPVVINPGQFPGCNGNCIYFTARVDCNGEEYGQHDNGIYDMVKGTVLPYDPPEFYHPNIVRPIWWTPNPW